MVVREVPFNRRREISTGRLVVRRAAFDRQWEVSTRGILAALDWKREVSARGILAALDWKREVAGGEFFVDREVLDWKEKDLVTSRNFLLAMYRK